MSKLSTAIALCIAEHFSLMLIMLLNLINLKLLVVIKQITSVFLLCLLFPLHRLVLWVREGGMLM